MKKRMECWFYRLLCILALAAIAFLAVTTVYSSDDYAYSLYFDNGLLGYLPLMVQHYQTVNGRALVHLFAHGLLEFSSMVFALVCLGCTLAVMLLCRRYWELTPLGKSRAMCIYLLLFLAMPASIMTQGVMWVSAFCNYVIPCVMVCLLIHLILGRCGFWPILILAFLCGATTEQMGAVTLAVLVLLALWDWREDDGGFRRSLSSILCAAAGYATIFLSPSTQGRLLRETKVGAPEALLPSLLSGFRRQTELLSVTPAPALVVTLVFLSWGWSLRRRRCWAPMAAVLGTAAVWLGCFGTGTVAHIGWAVVYVLLAVVGLELIWDRMELPGLLLFAAVASACIMMPTQSNRSRCFLPMYLFLCAAGALLTARATEGTKGRFAVPALSVLLVFSAVSCAPVLEGYWHNYRVDQINAAHVRQLEQGDALYYCMDYDKRYTDSKPYDSGGAYEDYYLQSVGLDPEQVSVLYYGEGYPEVYLEQTRLRFPAYQYGGKQYLPLRSVVEAAGGTVTLEQGKLLVTFGELICEIDYIPNGSTNVAWEGGSIRYDCSSNVAGFYLEECFYRELLGLKLEWSTDGTQVILRMP